MLALRILWTTLLNAFAEPLQTLKIFMLPLLLMVVGWALLLRVDQIDPYGPTPMAAVAMIVVLCAFCLPWCAVNFHRWILLDERVGWIPRVHLREMLSYAAICVPFLLALMALAFFSSLMAMHVVPPAISERFILMSGYMLLTQIVLTVIGLSLFSQLPGLAIGERLQSVFRHGKAAGTLFLIAIMLSVAVVIISIADAVIFNAMLPDLMSESPSIRLLIGLAIYRVLWVCAVIVLQLSLITTLYGYYAKGRPLR